MNGNVQNKPYEEIALTIQGPISNLLKEMNHKKKHTADSVTKRYKHFCCESYADDYGHIYCRNKPLHQSQYSKHFNSQSKEMTAVSLTLIL